MRLTPIAIFLFLASVPASTLAQEPSLLRDFDDEACRAHLQRARRHLRADEGEPALRVYEAGANECPEHAELLVDYGWVLARDERFTDALRVLGQAHEYVRSPALRAALLYSIGVAHQGLGHDRTAMQAYLGSLRIRESASASRRVDSLHQSFRRRHPHAVPIGTEGRVRLTAVEGAWGTLAPCEHYAQNPAASEMEPDSFECATPTHWSTSTVTFHRVDIADLWSSATEIWAEKDGRWLRIRAQDTSGGMLGGEYTTLSLDHARAAHLGGEAWFFTDLHVTNVDYDYEQAWRHDDFFHWACRVAAEVECVSIARGGDEFIGPGRCLYNDDCALDDGLVEADQRTPRVEERVARADVRAVWGGTRVRLVGRAAAPALRTWHTLDSLRSMTSTGTDAQLLFNAELELDGAVLSEADPVAAFIDPERVSR